MGPNIMVGIPAFNEERAIAAVVAGCLPYGTTVVVVDDGSTDKTAVLALQAGAVVIQHQVNGGKGAAVKTLFAYAIEHGVEALVLLDGDGQHDPAEIPLVLGPCQHGHADVVVGSRFLSGTKDGIPWFRRLGQRAFNGMTAIASGVHCSDSQSGFRAFRQSAICAMRLSESSFSVECEMQFEFRARNLRVVEVPISCSYVMPPKRNVLGHGAGVLYRLGAMMARQRLLDARSATQSPTLRSAVRPVELYESSVVAPGD